MNQVDQHFAERILERLAENIHRGQGWYCAHGSHERKVCRLLVEQKVLQTDDGHLFERYDPAWHAFVGLVEEAFLARQNTARARADSYLLNYAERTTRWLFQRALSDGQGGWNLTFKPTWDADVAAELVERYLAQNDYEEA